MPQGVTELTVPRRLSRSFEVRAAALNVEARTLELSFSSSTPIDRGWGVEILDHAPSSVRLERLNTEGPLLFSHDPNMHIGRVVEAHIDGQKGVATVKFSRSVDAETRFRDVQDGILRAVSVGYEIYEMQLESDKDGVKTYRVTDWEPLELSLVAVPADISVGVGRANGADGSATKTLKIRTNDMTPEEIAAAAAAQAAPAAGQQSQQNRAAASSAENEGIRKERQRVADIRAAGEQYTQRDLADKAVAEGITVEEFRIRLLTAIGQARAVQASDTAIEISERDLKKYSFLRAVQCMIQHKPVDGLEGELSREYGKKINRSPEGFFVPPEVLASAAFGQRAITVSGDGAALVASTPVGFIDVLRNRLLVRQLGATVLDGLQGDIYFNKQSGSGTAYWLAENAVVTDSGFAVNQAAMSPKRLAALVSYSKQLLLQGSPSVDALVRDDINKLLAAALDLAAIAGDGASNTPKGILHADNHNQLYAGGSKSLAPLIGTNANGANLTWSDMIKLETAVSAANADIGSLGYLTNTKVRGALKETQKAENTAQFVWQDGLATTPGFGLVNGYRAGASNQVPSNGTKGTGTGLSSVIFGNFSDVVIGMWGGMDILADPYTLAQVNQVRIVANMLSDVLVRRKDSFAAITDAITA